MLQQLYIKDFTLIKQLSLSFGEGLNLITGETGAGKSIILGALNLVLGGKATTDLIRTGSSMAFVQGDFDFSKNKRANAISKVLYERGIDSSENILILKREININAKGRSFINAQQVPVSLLKEIGSYLVDIHGQNEHQNILRTTTHLSILDRYSGLKSKADELMQLYSQYTKLRQKLKSVSLDEKEKNRRLDILKHEINEIEGARLTNDKELEDMLSQEKTLANAESILELISEGYRLLSQSEDSILKNTSIIKKNIEKVSEYDASLVDTFKSMENAYYGLEEVNHSIRQYMEYIKAEPEKLQNIRNRIDMIYGLFKKYGSNVKEVLDYLQKAIDEYEGIEISTEEEAKIREEIKYLEKKITDMATELSALRKEGSKGLEQNVQKELKDLGMSDTVLRTSIKWDFGEDGIYISPQDKDKRYMIHKNGLDHVEFLISTSQNGILRSLKNTISGGEMSRIMLAFKKVIIDSDPVATMIFDEVDSGIGGRIAEVVGKKVASLSANAQVIVITHLHQIASISAKSILHFKVTKESGSSDIKIKLLSNEQRIQEIARMVGGEEITVSAMDYARSLLKNN